MRWLHRQPTSTWTMHRQTVQAATSRSTARVFLDPILRASSSRPESLSFLACSTWVRRCVSRAATRRDQALEQPVSMRRRRARHRAPSSPAARRLRPGQATTACKPIHQWTWTQEDQEITCLHAAYSIDANYCFGSSARCNLFAAARTGLQRTDDTRL